MVALEERKNTGEIAYQKEQLALVSSYAPSNVERLIRKHIVWVDSAQTSIVDQRTRFEGTSLNTL
jgi:hypothetical protein